jgi:hypothetical protein
MTSGSGAEAPRGLKPTLLTLLLAAAFLAGVIYLFDLQFAAGDVYPEYSSLRTDPSGARLIYDSLARLPGLSLGRNYIPLDGFQENHATVVMLGFKPADFVDDSEMQLRLERLAKRGNRILVAMALPPGDKDVPIGKLYRNWDVKFAVDNERGHVHRLYFAAAKDWRVLDQIGDKMLAIERGFDKGSIVLLAESDDFSNAASVATDRLDLVTKALGAHTRIVFDESHFGIAESGSFVGLARRFRLTGMALGLALCAALFIWRSAAGFPPPEPDADTDRLAGRTSHAGLLTLLHRHIRHSDLAAACLREWLSANRRKTPAVCVEAAEAIVRRQSDPVEAMREAQQVLDSKGAL